MSALQRLSRLSALMDDSLRQFAMEDEEERASVPRMAVRGAAVGAVGAGGYAAYQNRDALKAGAIVTSAQAKKKAAELAGRGVMAGRGYLKKGAMTTADYLKSKGAKGGILRNVAGGIKSVAKNFSREEAELIVSLASRIKEIELAAAEDGLIEFGMTPEDKQNRWANIGKIATAGSLASAAGTVYKNRAGIKSEIGQGVSAVKKGAMGAADKIAKRGMKGGMLRNIASKVKKVAR